MVHHIHYGQRGRVLVVASVPAQVLHKHETLKRALRGSQKWVKSAVPGRDLGEQLSDVKLDEVDEVVVASVLGGGDAEARERAQLRRAFGPTPMLDAVNGQDQDPREQALVEWADGIRDALLGRFGHLPLNYHEVEVGAMERYVTLPHDRIELPSGRAMTPSHSSQSHARRTSAGSKPGTAASDVPAPASPPVKVHALPPKPKPGVKAAPKAPKLSFTKGQLHFTSGQLTFEKLPSSRSNTPPDQPVLESTQPLRPSSSRQSTRSRPDDMPLPPPRGANDFGDDIVPTAPLSNDQLPKIKKKPAPSKPAPPTPQPSKPSTPMSTKPSTPMPPPPARFRQVRFSGVAPMTPDTPMHGFHGRVRNSPPRRRAQLPGRSGSPPPMHWPDENAEVLVVEAPPKRLHSPPPQKPLGGFGGAPIKADALLRRGKASAALARRRGVLPSHDDDDDDAVAVAEAAVAEDDEKPPAAKPIWNKNFSRPRHSLP